MSLVTLVAGLLVLVGIAVAVAAAIAARQRQVRDLTSLLELRALEPAVDDDPAETSALLARSGAVAERFLGQSSSILARATAVLERSDWTLNAGELVVVSVIGGALAAIVAGLIGGVLAAVLFGVAVLFLPYALVLRSVTARRNKFDAQFPDVLDVLAASLESGASINQGLELIVAEGEDPLAGEFARVLAATRVGATLTDALEAAAVRLGSSDLDWTVQAIQVQQRTGGRLAEILRVVAKTMRDRFEVKRELTALTAEGRLSAYILGGLPFVLAGVISLVNPGYLTPLFHDVIGYVMLIGSAVLMAVAVVLMVRIIKVEV